jgi:DNA polymerase (family 10)
MKNLEIAAIFDRIADALELKGESVFRVNAYKKASRVLRDITEDVEELNSEGRLMDVPGIGEGISSKIDEYLKTGKMKKYDEVTEGIGKELLDLLAVQGLGPKTLSLAHEELGVENLADLKKVIENGSLAGLHGMGEKKVANIRKGIELLEKSSGRIPLGVAFPIVQRVVEAMISKGKVKDISPAGSLRRMVETVGDIDVLATGAKGAEIIKGFTELQFVTDVLARGSTKGSVMIEGETQVDLRVVLAGEFGSALQYFTGSKSHNVKLRTMARAKGLKLSEYGVFRGEKKIAGKTEEDVYMALGLPWIPPEMREDRGEIEAALEGKLPAPVRQEEILGDLHAHSRYSDGRASIADMAGAARKLGLKYIAICDHSKFAKYAGGIDEKALARQGKEIDELNRGMKGFRILKGIEVDILKDGSLDFSDDTLKKLDIVVASIHSGFKQNVAERMVKAMHNPHVDVIGHPTGRLISRREGYAIDVEAVMKAAADTGTALEINSYFDRLDLNDVNARKAALMGVKLSIGTDSHSTDTIWYVILGAGVARRAWLTKDDLLNTLEPAELAHRKK